MNTQAASPTFLTNSLLAHTLGPRLPLELMLEVFSYLSAPALKVMSLSCRTYFPYIQALLFGHHFGLIIPEELEAESATTARSEHILAYLSHAENRFTTLTKNPHLMSLVKSSTVTGSYMIANTENIDVWQMHAGTVWSFLHCAEHMPNLTHLVLRQIDLEEESGDALGMLSGLQSLTLIDCHIHNDMFLELPLRKLVIANEVYGSFVEGYSMPRFFDPFTIEYLDIAAHELIIQMLWSYGFNNPDQSQTRAFPSLTYLGLNARGMPEHCGQGFEEMVPRLLQKCPVLRSVAIHSPAGHSLTTASRLFPWVAPSLELLVAESRRAPDHTVA